MILKTKIGSVSNHTLRELQNIEVIQQEDIKIFKLEMTLNEKKINN